MQEKLLTVQNAAMIAAANTAAPSLAPFLDDETKNSSFKTEQSTPKFDFSSPLSLQFISHQASLSIYESLFINSGVIMLAVNMQGILVAANRGMQRFLHSMGINYEDIVGRAICPFASKPGFAQLKEFLVYQRRREAERQKVFGPPDPSTIDPLISNHCPLPTTLTSCWDSNAFVCDKKDGDDEISHSNGGSSVTLPPAPAHFAKPYPATERMMQKLFAGQEQMVTATHRWASRDGRLYEMQMTSYLVTEDSIPKYCIGVTSDDLIVCQT